MTIASRRRFLGLAAAASLTPIAGGARPAGAADEIRIGALCELTGDAAVYGKSMAAGMRLAVDEINTTGGILGGGPGIGGRPLRLLVEDAESSPPRALLKARKLVEQDRVAVLAGTAAASVALSVQEHVNGTARVPFLNAGSGNPSLSEAPACGKYTFQSAPNLRTLTMASRPVARKRGPRWYFIGDDYPLARLLVQLAKDAARQATPLQVVGEAYAHVATRDFTEYVRRAVQAKPDVIGVMVLGRGHARLLKDLRRMAEGIHVHSITWVRINADTAADVVVGMTAGEAFAFDNAATPRAAGFARAYRQAHGSWPDAFAARGYHAIETLALAARSAGTTGARALARALEAQVFKDSIYGEFRFRACDHVGVGTVLVVEGRWSEERRFHPAYLEPAGDGEAMLPACAETRCGPWTWS
jgi:ABC-type branched-subunit amino acid transport system substrate-binding protein